MNESTFEAIPQTLLNKLFQEQPERIVLDNGLVILFHEDHNAPLISVQTWVKTGSNHEGELLGSGLSHYLEHLLFKGTEKRQPGEIAREVQSLGGSINAYTAFDRTVYYIDGPSEQTSSFIDILADMVFHSTLSVEEVAKEKEVILREIDMGMDDPDRTITRKTLATAFHVHPYRYPVIGYRENFSKVTRDHLYDYYKSRYVPNNMVLSICGSITRDEMISAIETTFAKPERVPLKPCLIEPEPDQIAPRELREYGDYQICRGSLAYKIPSMRHPDSPAYDALATVLGSGYSGYLRQELRDRRKLVHHISASAWNPGEKGLFWIQYQCDSDKAVQAEAEILKTLEGFSNNFTSEEALNKAKRFAIVGEMQSRQTLSGYAGRMGLIEAVVGDMHYPAEYFSNLKNLTLDHLKHLAGKTFVRNQVTKYSLNSISVKPAPIIVKKRETLSDFQTIRLSNGARIVFQEDDRLPRVSMRYGGLGGPLFEDSQWRGATALMATLLTKDTRFRSESEVSNRLESFGGFMNESCGNNSFAVCLDFIPGDESIAIETFEEALLHPAFKDETVEREKLNQIASIQESNDEILDFGRRTLRQNFFLNHPFRSDPLGEELTVSHLQAYSLRAIYQKLFVGENAVISLCGDFNADYLIPRIETILNQLPSVPLRRNAYPFSGPSQIGEFRESLPREQSVVFDSFSDCGLSHSDYLKGEVLDEIFSDMSGPLFTKAREEKSLAYFVGSTRLRGIDLGMFSLYAGTAPNQVADIQQIFSNEIDRVRSSGLTPDEIQRTITHLKVQNRSQLQTLRSRAAQSNLNTLYGKPADDWKTFDSELDQITSDHLKQFAIKYLDPAKRVRLIVSPD